MVGFTYVTDMEELTYITIVIPLRIDSEERRANLDTALGYLCRYPEIKIILLEADNEPLYKSRMNHPNVSYIFIEDKDPIFYRTRYINRMLHEVRTPVAGIWDSDVIVPVEQIAEAVNRCVADYTLCYPFDGRFYAAHKCLSRLYKYTGNMDILVQNQSLHWLMHGWYSVGGAFAVNTEKYLSAGGENENMYGWGPEDTERRERICNLGLKIGRVAGCLYHLSHPRGINSDFASYERAIANRGEYMKICRMNRNELEKYITTWNWSIKHIHHETKN